MVRVIALLLGMGIGLHPARALEVVATFTVLADMVHQVGGERVHVTSLVGPDGDPHAFEPSPEDARRLRGADLVVVNGLGLEGWMTRLIAASGFRGQPVVASSGVVPLMMTEDGRRVADPHAWNSAAAGAAYARVITEALAAADPAGAEGYRARGARYGAELMGLDAEARRRLGAIPAERRRVLTSHDAFGYFGAAYGVEFLWPAGLSTEGEASAKTVAALIRTIRAEQVRVYFLENSNDRRLVQQVAAATGAQLGGTLYVEALSGPDGPAPTYAAMFRHNLRVLADAMER